MAGWSKKGLFVAAAIVASSAQGCRAPNPTLAEFQSEVDRDTAGEEASTGDGFVIESPAFSNGAPIGREYTRDGDNRTPPIVWSGAPRRTRSFALEVVDPDSPKGTFAHWLVWDLQPNARIVDGTAGVEGRNDFGKIGWGGPEAAANGLRHRYVFRLYALDLETLGLDEGATRADLHTAIRGHVLGATEITALYGK